MPDSATAIREHRMARFVGHRDVFGDQERGPSNGFRALHPRSWRRATPHRLQARTRYALARTAWTSLRLRTAASRSRKAGHWLEIEGFPQGCRLVAKISHDDFGGAGCPRWRSRGGQQTQDHRRHKVSRAHEKGRSNGCAQGLQEDFEFPQDHRSAHRAKNESRIMARLRADPSGATSQARANQRAVVGESRFRVLCARNGCPGDGSSGGAVECQSASLGQGSCCNAEYNAEGADSVSHARGLRQTLERRAGAQIQEGVCFGGSQCEVHHGAVP